VKKTAYKKELIIKGTQKRFGANNSKDVRKIQSWLSLFAISNPNAATATGIDGDFGPATQHAVKNYQKANDITPSGVVTQELFDKLTKHKSARFSTGSCR